MTAPTWLNLLNFSTSIYIIRDHYATNRNVTDVYVHKWGENSVQFRNLDCSILNFDVKPTFVTSNRPRLKKSTPTYETNVMRKIKI